jgi:hypothetical protein
MAGLCEVSSEKYCLLACDAVYCGRSLTTFRRSLHFQVLRVGRAGKQQAQDEGSILI